MKNTHRIKDILESVTFVLSIEIMHITSDWSWHNGFAILIGVGAGYGVGCVYQQLVDGDRAFSAYIKSQYKDACAEWLDLERDLYHSEKLLFEQNSAFPEPRYPLDKAAPWINLDNPYNFEFRQRVALIKQMTEQVDERIGNVVVL